jgi:hypothetical protein
VAAAIPRSEENQKRVISIEEAGSMQSVRLSRRLRHRKRRRRFPRPLLQMLANHEPMETLPNEILAARKVPVMPMSSGGHV